MFCAPWRRLTNGRMLMKQTKKTFILVATCVVCLCLGAVLLTFLFNTEPSAPEPQATTTQIETTLYEPPTENVFTPLDFAYEGDYLTCTTAPSMRGIDISTHQKEIDFLKVKEAGFEFVMIRLGYRGSIEGVLFEDEWAQRNYEGAIKAGLKVGGYFFSQSISPEEAVEEAEYAMKIMDGWTVEMPVVYDWEFIQEGYRTDVVDARLLTDCTKAFCDTVEKAGYKAMLYFNPSQSRKQMHLEELTDYGFWLAMYSEEMTYEYKVDMWQYSCTGKVPGIEGNVDINLYFPYDEIS